MSSKKGSRRTKKNGAYGFRCNYGSKIYESIKYSLNVSIKVEKVLRTRAGIILVFKNNIPGLSSEKVLFSIVQNIY